MSATMSVTRTRLERLLDERVTIQRMHESVLEQAEKREDHQLNEYEQEQIKGMHDRQAQIDDEVKTLAEALEREENAAAASSDLRRHLHSQTDQVDTVNGETRYRSFHAYARDAILVKFRDQAPREVRGLFEGARQRLERAPQHTTTDDIDGLLPPQHIQQLMDVIDATRPVISSSSNRLPLSNGRLSWPQITGRPEVLLQASEKTEGGTLDMNVEMVEGTAQTFIGGGNLSWQAINWSSPDALALWFRLAGEAYARKTEGTACAVLMAAGTAVSGGTITGGTADTFAKVVASIVGGAAAVYTNSGAMADTLWLSPDVFFNIAGLTTDAGAPFITAGQLNLSGRGGNVAGINVVASYGFGTSTAIIGDSSAFMVGETPGAPVELRAVEPAIGGLEVGVIGAFKAVAFDDLRFATLIS